MLLKWKFATREYSTQSFLREEVLRFQPCHELSEECMTNQEELEVTGVNDNMVVDDDFTPNF